MDIGNVIRLTETQSVSCRVTPPPRETCTTSTKTTLSPHFMNNSIIVVTVCALHVRTLDDADDALRSFLHPIRKNLLAYAGTRHTFTCTVRCAYDGGSARLGVPSLRMICSGNAELYVAYANMT